jgi:hypothetical protein
VVAVIGRVQLLLSSLMGTTQVGDKNNVALKSRVLPRDELMLVSPLEVPEITFNFCLHVKNVRTISSYASTFWFFVWCYTAGSVVHDHWNDKMKAFAFKSCWNHSPHHIEPQVT